MIFHNHAQWNRPFRCWNRNPSYNMFVCASRYKLHVQYVCMCKQKSRLKYVCLCKQKSKLQYICLCSLCSLSWVYKYQIFVTTHPHRMINRTDRILGPSKGIDLTHWCCCRHWLLFDNFNTHWIWLIIHSIRDESAGLWHWDKWYTCTNYLVIGNVLRTSDKNYITLYFLRDVNTAIDWSTTSHNDDT